MDNNVFYIDMDGKKVMAEVLFSFSYYDNLYCAYSIKDDDTGLNNVYSAKIVDGVLIDITDDKERQFIEKYIYNLFSIVKEKK